MAFVSVIIPIYNVEKYLRQCIDSVIAQDFHDIEIILVDDGSPDSCPQICDEYAEKYDYIKVIHKENGGLSSARNAGIQAANGKYIIFMDSDDWWNPDVSVKEILSQVYEKPDVEMFLLTSLDYVEGQGLYKRKEHNFLDEINTENVEAYYQSLLNNGNLEVHAATKIFKAEFIKQNNLYFPLGMKGEDNEWMIRVLRVLNKVDIINRPIYIYRAGRVGSISNSITKENIVDLLNIVRNSLIFYRETTKFDAIKDKELCFCAYLWFTALGLSTKISKEDYKAVVPEFRATAWVCKYSNSKKTKMAYSVYKILGLSGAKRVLGFYIKLKNKKNMNRKKQESL